MLRADDTLDGSFPFKAQFSGAAGFRQHFVDEGPRNGKETLLMLHGEPTWSYLFREQIAHFSSRYRVVAPDHMGFGKSETPADRPYSLEAHVDNLESLVRELDLRDITLVMHDWGGPIGTGLALRHPERIRRFIVTNSVVPLGLPHEEALLRRNSDSAWFRWVGHLHAAGKLETVLGELGAIILGVMRTRQGFVRMSHIDDAWLRAYSEPFASPTECLGAISFPRSIITGVGSSLPPASASTVAALRALPAMMIEGMEDRALLPEIFIPLFQQTFPASKVHTLPNAGHFLFEDEPETITDLIERFLNEER